MCFEKWVWLEKLGSSVWCPQPNILTHKPSPKGVTQSSQLIVIWVTLILMTEYCMLCVTYICYIKKVKHQTQTWSKSCTFRWTNKGIVLTVQRLDGWRVLPNVPITYVMAWYYLTESWKEPLVIQEFILTANQLRQSGSSYCNKKRERRQEHDMSSL